MNIDDSLIAEIQLRLHQSLTAHEALEAIAKDNAEAAACLPGLPECIKELKSTVFKLDTFVHTHA